MRKINKLEPLVKEALKNDECKRDDFLLYLTIIGNIVNVNISIKSALENHKILGLPSFESVTRCRRKLQERDNSLKIESVARKREAYQKEFIDYAMEDKVIY